MTEKQKTLLRSAEEEGPGKRKTLLQLAMEAPVAKVNIKMVPSVEEWDLIKAYLTGKINRQQLFFAYKKPHTWGRGADARIVTVIKDMVQRKVIDFYYPRNKPKADVWPEETRNS